MGITGLLPLLKKASKNCHVRRFSGCTVAIDAYGWLHKGAFGCAEKLGKGEPTTAYISYCMKYIQILLDNNVKPILVLDGRNLPSKEHTEKKRRQKRDENRKLARKYLQEGKKKEAWECFTRCVDITPAMAREFIKALRSMKIDYVVAPYEADAQLAYLAKTGIADVIITEDSDLVLFECPKIFFKMNANGDGVLFDASKLPQCWDSKSKNFKFQHFRWMCILSGCDYLPSLPGIGLGRAKKVIEAANHDSIEQMINSIPTVLDKVQVEITDEYIQGFIQAENTFLYQLVFDTVSRTLMPLNPYPDNLGPKQLPFAGSYQYEKIATELALGNVDLHTLKTVDNFDPLKAGYTSTSIWSPFFQPRNVQAAKLDEVKSIGMELSVSKKSPVKRKRSLKVTSLENDEDKAPGDNELFHLYGDNSKKRSSSGARSKPGEDVEMTESDSSASKRRCLTSVVEDDLKNNSMSSIISPRLPTRNVPFRKSQEKSNVVVRSKYFRSEPTSSATKKPDESQELEDDDEDKPSVNGNISSSGETKLNIYSYDSSQASELSAFSDISASSQHVQESQKQDFEADSAFEDKSTPEVICPAVSTDSEKPKPEVITVADEEEDEAYGSSNSSNNSLSAANLTRTVSVKLFRLENSPTGSFSQYFKSSGGSNKSPTTISSTNKTTPARNTRSASAKLMTPCRRVGLSKNTKSATGTKKDPKQLSVKDMFQKRL